MRDARLSGAPGNPIRVWSRHPLAAGLGAAVLVALAVIGPPATAQSVAPLIELRHEVLMMDREFERFSMRASPSSAPTGGAVSAELADLGSPNDRSRIRDGGGVS
jgi:hypothetical protein